MYCLLFWSLTHANIGVECSGRDSWEKMGQPLAKLLHVSLEFCLLSQLYPSRYFDILLQFNPPVERSNESSIVSLSYCNIIGHSPNSGSLITITPSYNHLRSYNKCIVHLICEGFIWISLELLCVQLHVMACNQECTVLMLGKTLFNCKCIIALSVMFIILSQYANSGHRSTA